MFLFILMVGIMNNIVQNMNFLYLCFILVQEKIQLSKDQLHQVKRLRQCSKELLDRNTACEEQLTLSIQHLFGENPSQKNDIDVLDTGQDPSLLISANSRYMKLDHICATRDTFVFQTYWLYNAQVETLISTASKSSLNLTLKSHPHEI